MLSRYRYRCALIVLVAMTQPGGAENAPQSVHDCEDRCAELYPTDSQQYADCVRDCVTVLEEGGG